jgi:hypothetical protein
MKAEIDTEIDLLRKWADDSTRNGWSTQLVGPMQTRRRQLLELSHRMGRRIEERKIP